ncbi:DUF4411 family protein [Nocardioides sp.]|uniref:DUF4411 family protein n=1 Tax=Nocardioides sp. TaxID=35761 RepID=UPI003784B6F8
MTYLFDSNTFMEAARLYYHPEVAPGFWAWLIGDPMRDRIASVPAVQEEIANGEGELVDWARNTVPDCFWRPVTPDTLRAAAELSTWATDPARAYKQAAIDEFLDSCDYWLIAEAHAAGLTVVTREVSAPESRSRIKIPDVCRAFGIDCAQPFPVYQRLGLRLQQ